MNWPTLVLVVLIALLQYPLWLGKGGWLRVWDYDRQLQAQREHNQTLEQRNAALDADVRDLKSGYEAIEERARYELGMIKEGEIFVQVPQKTPALCRASGCLLCNATSSGSRKTVSTMMSCSTATWRLKPMVSRFSRRAAICSALVNSCRAICTSG
jgi:cell division protein FtsB